MPLTVTSDFFVEHTLVSRSGRYTRRVWTLEPEGGAPERVALFLDGEYYAAGMEISGLVHDLTREGKMPKTLCVFLSHGDRFVDRHQDFVCDAEFTSFVVEELVAWVTQRYPEVPREGWLIVGASLSGLEAAFITLNYPATFSRCLSQSGSFWWEGERLREQLEHPEQLERSPARFWVSVGDRETVAGVTHPRSGLQQEVSQIVASERFVRAAEARGHEVHFHLFSGGHNFAPWLAELPEALTWLLAPCDHILHERE